MEIFTFLTHPALSYPSPPQDARSCQCHSGTWGFQASPEVEVKLAAGIFLRPTSLPIVSMSGIFTYTYHETQLNVGKCTIHGSYGLDMGHTVGGSEIR